MMISLTAIFYLVCVVIPLTYYLFWVNKKMSNDDDVMMRITIFLLSLGLFILMVGMIVQAVKI